MSKLSRLARKAAGADGGTASVLFWALASFHAAALVFVAVVSLWLSSGLTSLLGDGGSSSTVAGIGAFAVLWFAAYIGTIAGLPEEVPRRLTFWDCLDLAVGRRVLGGAITGLVFLVSVSLIGCFGLVVAAMVEGNAETAIAAPLAIVAGIVGSPFAAGIGGIIGFVFGLIDTVLLFLAARITSTGPTATPNAETPAT
jgi:hypothetical protein